jgi:hypothetical protein
MVLYQPDQDEDMPF